MTENNTYSIQVGEHEIAGTFGAAAHLSIRFVNNNTNERIVEINGLATDRNTGEIRAVGVPWRDDIKGHIWNSETQISFWNSERTRSTDTIATKPLSELEQDIRIVVAVVDAVNGKGITYNPIGTNSNSFAFDVLAGLGYSQSDVLAITDRLTPGLNLDLLTDAEIRAIRDSIVAEGISPECFVKNTAIKVVSDTEESRYKPICSIAVGDIVQSYDMKGNLRPGRVIATFSKEVDCVLDFFGTGMTPGHFTLCGDGEFV